MKMSWLILSVSFVLFLFFLAFLSNSFSSKRKHDLIEATERQGTYKPCLRKFGKPHWWMIFTTTTLWVICNNGSRLFFKLVELKAPKSHFRHFFSYMNCWRNWPPLKTPTIKSVSRDLKLFLHSLLKVCMSSHDVSTPLVDLRQEGKSRFTTPALVY